MSLRVMRLEARVENLEAMLGFVTDCARELAWSEKRLPDVELVVEEAVVNVCKYAYPEGIGMLELSAGGDDHSFFVSITDSGIPFDILAAAEPDLTAGIDEREIGGLGCFLIRTLSDRASYRRDGGRNILELTFLRERARKTVPEAGE
jgi:anti-sigma regulatory factor (Ser/Thr protein kinase)